MQAGLEVEAYIRNQVGEERLADQRFREMLKSFTVVNPLVDLSQPTESNSGRYWYNLHLVLVVAERAIALATRQLWSRFVIQWD